MHKAGLIKFLPQADGLLLFALPKKEAKTQGEYKLTALRQYILQYAH